MATVPGEAKKGNESCESFSHCWLVDVKAHESVSLDNCRQTIPLSVFW